MTDVHYVGRRSGVDLLILSGKLFDSVQQLQSFQIKIERMYSKKCKSLIGVEGGFYNMSSKK